MLKFWHKEFNVEKELPEGWAEQLISMARNAAVLKELIPKSVTSRESQDVHSIQVATVGGLALKSNAPWLYDLYKTTFRDYGRSCIDEDVLIAKDDRYAINLNVQMGNEMRYECHVDTNPLEGLLYVTDHPSGSGGELVVSNNTEAKTSEEVDEDCILIYPRSGHLVFFDARYFPHYARHLKSKNDIRVVVAMNYYTPSWPESKRASDLNKHLGLE